MTMGPINNPHDGFFKQTFGRIEVARGFLVKFLPVDVAACLNLDSLEPTKDSFVDEEFRQTFSDLVFTIELAQGGRFFLDFSGKGEVRFRSFDLGTGRWIFAGIGSCVP